MAKTTEWVGSPVRRRSRAPIDEVGWLGHNAGGFMRARLLALTICLVGWASSPVAALLVSVHVLEHESDAPSHSLDHLSIRGSGALYSSPIPVALPPPRHQALCVMLL